MTSIERSKLINDIVSRAPAGLGLAKHSRANLEKMTDDALRALHAKLKLVAAHVAKSPIKRRANLDSRRAALSARRAERYDRLAKFGTTRQPAVGNLLPILDEVMASEAPKFRISVKNFGGGEVEPHSAVRVWNSFDRASEHPVEHMRYMIRSWLGEFAAKVIGKPETQAHFWALLDGPLKPEFENYMQFACDKIGRDALRLVRNNIMHGNIYIGDAVGASLPLGVLEALTREVVETAFVPTSGKIRETDAIDGLAKMRAVALRYQPDAILSVSSGGRIVGDFIALEAKLSKPHTRAVYFRGQNAIVKGGWRALRSCRRILLVDDVAASPDLLSNAHRSLLEHLGDRDIQMVALASSIDTRETLIQNGHANVFVAHLAGGEVDVPWDRTGSYEINNLNHIFGVGGGDPLRIARKQLQRVSQSLEVSAVAGEEAV